MGQLVNIRAGRWNKTDEGRWKFEEDNSEVYHYIVARTNEGFEEFTKLVRQQLRIEDLCPLLVTYQLPGCMVQDDPSAHAPITLLTSEDIEIMMSVKEWKNEVVTCVTYGALNIAKYQFLCRSPFTIGDTTYLADGITEEVHCRMINSMVEDDEFTCAGSVLKQLFSEEKLILVYRFSFEIEEARKFFDRFPTPEIGGTRRETQKSRTTTQRKKSQNCGTQDKGDYQCPSDYPEEAIIRLNVDEDAAYLNADWEDVVAGQQNVGHGIDPECYVTEATPHNLTSLSNGDQRSTSCLNINVVDLVTSSTGSTGDVNVTVIGNTCWNPITVPWGDNSDRGETSMRPSKTFQGATEEEMTELLPQLYVNVNDDSDIPLSPKLQTPRRQSIIGEDDSGSLIVGKKGVGADNQSDIYVGMIFNSREDFKLHMAMYAIRNKFRLRHSRSSPGGMEVELNHSCTVDDRTGYQSQATHTVIGGMMKGKFAGRGGGPRPNDIREAMQGDHDVHISYWKAWRSREVALDYAKGSSGASYNLLPTYLEKLVMANPGSITQIHTEYADGIGHRFKYMFMALAASIEGYRFMRKVVIVDGSHLRGKYAGCLLTASAQDGNYQVFPLAVAVVDSENDKAWEWFFTKLSQFIPNNEEIVFVSDRHPSIYMAIAKGNRYNIMTSNVAETWNSVLRDAREYPILSLIEYIRAKLMTWFAKRRQIKRGEGQMVTPRVEEILAANFERSGSLWVTMIGEAEYKVRNKEGATFHVNLSQKTCTCHEFQALLIPCTHAIAAATRAQIRIDSLVDGCYSRSTYTAAYANIINPVVEYESIEILSSDNSVSGVEINRPSSRRPPGRPRKSRILSRGEFQTRGPKKRTVCSRCKGGGHNRATCKVAI